ncbi:MAG: hypothetical protein RMM51_10955 [Verrucomicrobiae bacterium]|nr:hypothetical protein [Verrucomicrobiae bacterium]
MNNTPRWTEPVLRYAPIGLLICILLNIYFVMRHFELARTHSRVEERFQNADAQRRAYEGVLREFLARSSNDAVIQQIFLRHQSSAQPSTQPNP